MAWKNDQVNEKETARILELARACVKVPGDFVEMGCYRGDTSLILAEMLQRDARLREKVRCSVDVRRSTSPSATPSSSPSIYAEASQELGGKDAKKLWIYDSFEGLPEKKEVDKSVMGVLFRSGELAATKREVKERFLRANLPVPRIKKAWFSDLTPEDMPEKIAFAFLDGDFYESIRDSLRLVTPRMSDEGILFVHDYTNPALPGVKRAVDEWNNREKYSFEVILL